MNKHCRTAKLTPWALLLLTLLLLPGCELGNTADAPYPTDLSGSWSGIYSTPSGNIAIEAIVEQDGNNVAIGTTMSGVGEMLTGVINEDGSLSLMDGFDAQTWTSPDAATPNHIHIRDYVNGPGSSTQDIILSR